MKTWGKAASVAVAALLLAGCASQAEPAETSTPEPTIDANAAACDAFATASAKVGEAVTGGNGKGIDIPATYDAVALTADGDVKDRILGLIDNLPDPPHMIVWGDNVAVYTADVESVERACGADGYPIGATKLRAG